MISRNYSILYSMKFINLLLSIFKTSLCVQGRALVGEGILIKECRKKPKPRYFFLFNDVLVYGTSVMGKKKYINQHIINLNNLQIKSIADSSNPSRLISRLYISLVIS